MCSLKRICEYYTYKISMIYYRAVTPSEESILQGLLCSAFYKFIEIQKEK